MNTLVASLDDQSKTDKACGENGHLMYKESAVNSLLVLYNRLCRGLTKDDLSGLINNVISDINKCDDKLKGLCNLFTLCFQTRNIRGGKGEKELSYKFLIDLYYNKDYSELVLDLLHLLPDKYGSWQDINILGDLILEDKKVYKDRWYDGELDADEVKERITLINRFIKHIVQMYIKQLNKDYVDENPSLCSKWAAREGKRYWNVGKIIALTKFPATNNAEKYSSYKKWNKYIKNISDKLNIVEKHMCNGNWSNIIPKNVPAVCLKKNKNAFVNPDDSISEDRKQCRANFMEHIEKCNKGEATLHGSILHPHELVQSYLNSMDDIVASMDNIVEIQWRDLIDDHKSNMEHLGKSIQNLFIMSDVSGSMYAEYKGTRMIDPCIALSLACSELQTGPLKNRCLTFSSNPEWVVFEDDDTLYNRVNQLYKSDWGYNTDLNAAFTMILDHIVENDINPSTITDSKFLILSDMQFDSSGVWNATLYQEIKKMFKEAGLRTIWCKPYTMPEIIFWNLNGGYENMIDNGEKPGVTMLSGYSPTAFYDFVGNVTPLETLQNILDSDQYEEIKTIIYAKYGYTEDLQMDEMDDMGKVDAKENVEPEPEPCPDDEYILVD